MQFKKTENGIEYDESTVGRYLIFPTKNKHSKEDVEKAKQWLHSKVNVVSIKTIWQKNEITNQNGQ